MLSSILEDMEGSSIRAYVVDLYDIIPGIIINHKKKGNHWLPFFIYQR
jgi:hypothetical protein